jgi:hypothetical protein
VLSTQSLVRKSLSFAIKTKDRVQTSGLEIQGESGISSAEILMLILYRFAPSLISMALAQSGDVTLPSAKLS